MFGKRLWMLAAAVLLALPLLAQAQSSGQPQVDAAVADLSQRLGVPLTINDIREWNFAENRYPDTSLGCAIAPNAPYTAGSFRAFQVTLNYQGTVYDYRVSSDLTIVFPCDAALLGGETPTVLPTAAPTAELTAGATVAATPTTAAILPSGCPADFAGFLAPRLQVGGSAQVAVGGAPNRLRQTAALAGAQIGLIDPGQPFDVIGGPVCADNFVWWQVSSNGVVGWTAEGNAPSTYFLEPVAAAQPTPAVTATATLAVVPLAEGELPLLAGVQGGSVVLYRFAPGAAPQPVAAIPVTSNPAGVSALRFSPQGDRIGFIAAQTINNETIWTLYVASVDGTQVTALADDLYPAMPFVFNADGDGVLYAVQDREAPLGPATGEWSGSREQLIFVEQALDAPATAREEVGRASFGVGCGGGSPYPGDGAFNIEVGFGGRPLALLQTPYGLVYSTNCSGSGTALLNVETGESTPLGETLSRVVLSADGEQLAGVTDAQAGFGSGPLTIITLETLQTEERTPAGDVGLLAWATDGSGDLFYTTRFVSEAPVVPASAALEAQGVGPVPLFEVTIQRMTAEDDVMLFNDPALAVGRLLPAADGSLYFSLVPNGQDWAEAVNAGTLPESADWTAILDQYFPVTLFVLPADASTEIEPAPLVQGLGRAALNPAGETAASG